jgi:TolB-like protein/DNA-binding winged helix-turn-helix (wHTH) protein/Tfp pilus assembly protein PilF
MTDNKNDDDDLKGVDSGGLGFDLDKGFRLGDIEVLPRQSTIVREGIRDSLEPKAMEVLVCLAKRDGDTVTRSEFEDEVWTGRIVSPENLDRAISVVRKALGDTAKERKFVQTIQTVGYRLIADVTPLQTEAVQAGPTRRSWAIASAAVATVAAVVFFVAINDPGDPPLPLTTISVQCFDNLSDAPESEYFAEGLAVEIRAALSRLDGIRVVSRASSKSLCESGLPISEIGEQLDAGSILEGSVRRDGGQVRIGVQLGDANNDKVVLSENYSGALADIFDLQNRIATDIARQMSVTLAPGEQLVVAPTQDLDAYQLYLRAHFQLRRRGVEPMRRAIELFREAIARDPGYGRAYQGLAQAYAVAPFYTGGDSVPMMEMSLAALDKADALGGTDSHAHAIRGFIHFHKREWESAHAEFRAALKGEPDDSDLLQWYSLFLAELGYIDQALIQAQKSVKEDPLSPVAHQRLAVVMVWQDDLDSAAEQFRIATEELGLDPMANARAMFPLMLRRDEYDLAQAFAEAAYSVAGSPTDWWSPMFAYQRGEGPAGPAVDALRAAYDAGTLDQRVYVGALYYLDDVDMMFDAIDGVVDLGRPLDHEVWFVADGRALQDDPRFPALLQRIGILDYWEAHGWPQGCHRVGDLIQCDRASESGAQASAGDPPVS